MNSGSGSRISIVDVAHICLNNIDKKYLAQGSLIQLRNITIQSMFGTWKVGLRLSVFSIGLINNYSANASTY
jgi:hypothetical protein